MKSGPTILSAAAIGLIALSPLAAHAHPMLVRSNPAAGEKAKEPIQISLWFSEKIEPVYNKIEVVDGVGAHFEDGKPTVDASDRALLHVRVKQLPAGTYRVRWRVSAADSHKMEGSFSFQVAR